ncbi:MAG: M48 family metallopeptidase [Aestuariivirga sp.]
MAANAASAVLGAWLLWEFWPNLFAIVGGVVLLGLAWIQRPRLGSVPERTLSRTEFPRLFRLVDDVVASLGAKPIEHVVVDANFNASMSTPGWHRTPVLTLGLPLLSALTGQQRVALVAHEIAHSVNGDPSRGTLLSIALSTLDGWIGVLMQDSRDLDVGLASLIANMVMRALAAVLMLIRYGILRLTYVDSQRAEYLADYLSARVAGTDAAISSFGAITAAQHIGHFVASSYDAVDDRGLSLIERLGAYLRSLPPGERERLRRCSLAEQAHIDETHPSNSFRVQFLNAHRIEQPSVVLTDKDSAEIDRELSKLEPGMSERFMASVLGER